MTCVPTCSLILDGDQQYRSVAALREGDYVSNPLNPYRPSKILKIVDQATDGLWPLYEYGGFRGAAHQSMLLGKQWVRMDMVASPCWQLCTSLTGIVVERSAPVHIDGRTVATMKASGMVRIV